MLWEMSRADDISRKYTSFKMSAPTESEEVKERVEEHLSDNNDMAMLGQDSDVGVKTLSKSEVKERVEEIISDNDDMATLEQDGDVGATTLSKSQLKKLKKKEKWDVVKGQKRKAERERYKARKRACRERGQTLGPTRKQLSHNKMSKSDCKIRVAIDCDFDEYMSDKDIKNLVKQIQYSYSANRRADNPLQFYCCSVTGKTKERLENIGDFKGWDINFHAQSFTEMFEKSSVVYLSSESSNILHTLEDDKVYVIGGLVDHNHHKGLCHRLAEERRLSHAQLPISDYIDMKTRKTLTVNHVFEILLRHTETHDWQKAFYSVLPPRKGAKLKNSGTTNPEVQATDGTSLGSCKDTVRNIDITVIIQEDEAGISGENEVVNSDCKVKKCTEELRDKELTGVCASVSEDETVGGL